MRPFCEHNVLDHPDWKGKKPKALIEKGVCPAWVLASTSVLGRCLPGRKQIPDNNQQNSPRILNSQNTGTSSQDTGNGQ